MKQCWLNVDCGVLLDLTYYKSRREPQDRSYQGFVKILTQQTIISASFGPLDVFIQGAKAQWLAHKTLPFVSYQDSLGHDPKLFPKLTPMVARSLITDMQSPMGCFNLSLAFVLMYS